MQMDTSHMKSYGTTFIIMEICIIAKTINFFLHFMLAKIDEYIFNWNWLKLGWQTQSTCASILPSLIEVKHHLFILAFFAAGSRCGLEQSFPSRSTRSPLLTLDGMYLPFPTFDKSGLFYMLSPLQPDSIISFFKV